MVELICHFEFIYSAISSRKHGEGRRIKKKLMKCAEYLQGLNDDVGCCLHCNNDLLQFFSVDIADFSARSFICWVGGCSRDVVCQLGSQKSVC